MTRFPGVQVQVGPWLFCVPGARCPLCEPPSFHLVSGGIVKSDLTVWS